MDEALVVAGSSVPAGSEVAVDATLTAAVGGIEVEGTVTAPWEGTCRRCLRPVGGRLEVAVRELYCPPIGGTAGYPGAARHPGGHRPGERDRPPAGPRPGERSRDRHHPQAGGPERGAGAATSVADQDEETYPLAGDHIDLEPLARDALLLALPLAPLCTDDCPGLCPACGADLSGGPCGCAGAPADDRWAALDVLRDPGDAAGAP